MQSFMVLKPFHFEIIVVLFAHFPPWEYLEHLSDDVNKQHIDTDIIKRQNNSTTTPVPPGAILYSSLTPHKIMRQSPPWLPALTTFYTHTHTHTHTHTF
jgi:hypothetical protein